MMAQLRVHIVVEIDGEGWEGEHLVTVPPDYNQRDIEPFVQHEMDKAMTALQRSAFGFSRSDQIIRQYDRRLTIVKRLLRLAPHDIRRRPVVERVKDVIDMDSAELFARFGDERLED
jgi:hypothetical protein